MPVAVACCSILLFCAPARAQEPAAEPTPAQVELYQRANEAFARDEYENAIELLQSALALGDLNILHLSLGRTLFRDGRCAEAALHYERALVTPAVADPPGQGLRHGVARHFEKEDQARGQLTEAHLELDIAGTPLLVVRQHAAFQQQRV